MVILLCIQWLFKRLAGTLQVEHFYCGIFVLLVNLYFQEFKKIIVTQAISTVSR